MEHVTRFSDSSVCDFICVNCGASEGPFHNHLASPCLNPPPPNGSGLTLEQYWIKDQERLEKLAEQYPILREI